MAIKYLDAKRLQGTNAERLAMTSSANVPASLCYNMTLDTTNEILGSGCWSFDGSSSYVDLTQALFRNGFWASGGSAFTVAYWFRASSGDYFTYSTQCMTSSESENCAISAMMRPISSSATMSAARPIAVAKPTSSMLPWLFTLTPFSPNNTPPL